MTHKVIKITNEKEWLNSRNKGIGGSDAGAILGVNPYKSNVDLFLEKICMCQGGEACNEQGKKEPDNISDKPAVIYGKKAEEHLRALFMLDNPQYTLHYSPFDILQSLENPFMQGTLDGELTDSEGNKGILEIKTCEIKNSLQWRQWDNKVPDYYYAQIIHYFALDVDFKFAILNAQLKYASHGEGAEQQASTVTKRGEGESKITKTYEFKREDVIEDINYLIQEEKSFWVHVQSGNKPPLKLPEV